MSGDGHQQQSFGITCQLDRIQVSHHTQKESKVFKRGEVFLHLCKLKKKTKQILTQQVERQLIFLLCTSLQLSPVGRAHKPSEITRHFTSLNGLEEPSFIH